MQVDKKVPLQWKVTMLHVSLCALCCGMMSYWPHDPRYVFGPRWLKYGEEYRSLKLTMTNRVKATGSPLPFILYLFRIFCYLCMQDYVLWSYKRDVGRWWVPEFLCSSLLKASAVMWQPVPYLTPKVIVCCVLVERSVLSLRIGLQLGNPGSSVLSAVKILWITWLTYSLMIQSTSQVYCKNKMKKKYSHVSHLMCCRKDWL